MAPANGWRILPLRHEREDCRHHYRKRTDRDRGAEGGSGGWQQLGIGDLSHGTWGLAIVVQFRLGLVGVGRMGRAHLRALKESSLVRVVAVADTSAEARAELGASGLEVHPDIDSLLDRHRLDGVLLAAPSEQHLELVRRVAFAGLPVLCEKPCGLTAIEARAAAQVAREAGIYLQVAYWRRFVALLQQLRRRILQGALGDPYFLACFQWDGAPPARQFRLRSGGIFIDMGVHEFDQLRWLTGQEFTEIHAVAADVAAEPPVREDAESAQVLCRLSGGGTALVSLGRRHPLGDVCWAEVFGTEGAEDCRFLWPPEGEKVFLQALRNQAESFARTLHQDSAEGASAVDAARALEVAQQASSVLLPSR